MMHDLLQNALERFKDETEETHGVIVDLSTANYHAMVRDIEKRLHDEGGNMIDEIVEFLTELDEECRLHEYGIFVESGLYA